MGTLSFSWIQLSFSTLWARFLPQFLVYFRAYGWVGDTDAPYCIFLCSAPRVQKGRLAEVFCGKWYCGGSRWVICRTPALWFFVVSGYG